MPAFQTTGGERLQQAIPPANPWPVRVCSQDDSRFGWLTVRRRRLTAPGVQPIGPVPHGFAWFDVDGAVAPTTGDRFVRARPSLNPDGCQICVDAVAAALADRLNLLLRDHSGAPTAPRLTLPATVRLVCWPPYGPALHPIERVWRALKDALAWLPCPTLAGQQDDIATLLRGSEAATLQALTGYTSLVEAIHALCPS
jgi:hypothetical protein